MNTAPTTMTLSIANELPAPAKAYEPTSNDIKRHMHLVYKVVGQMQRRLQKSVLRDDLVSAGTVGLLDALRRNAGDIGTPSFEAYVCIRVRGAIVDELRRLDWSPRRAKAAATTGENAAAPAPVAVSVVRFDDLPTTCEPVAAGGCPEAASQASELRAAVRAALAELPARDREILQLRYFEDVPAKEIAAKLGVSEARVSQLHARATTALRRALVALDERRSDRRSMVPVSMVPGGPPSFVPPPSAPALRVLPFRQAQRDRVSPPARIETKEAA